MNTFSPRRIEALSADRPDGLKLYSISCSGDPVEAAKFDDRLKAVIAERKIGAETAGFAIFHEGATIPYLVVCWWENENELFTSVSIKKDGHDWMEDPENYSFCLWDLEVIWHERNSFIQNCYSGQRDLEGYRRDLFETPPPVG